jgi:hypothetical protein
MCRAVLGPWSPTAWGVFRMRRLPMGLQRMRVSVDAIVAGPSGSERRCQAVADLRDAISDEWEASVDD